MKIKLVLFIAFTVFASYTYCQKLEKDKKYFTSAIGFWNVENLYDTLNDVWKNDEEFTPSGKNVWNGSRYRTKIEHLADAISQMATDVTPDGLAIMGLCEIENKAVVKDLVNSPKLKKRNYQIVHIEGPDIRGVDPSFIYNPSYFKVIKSVSYHVTLADTGRKTRDILVVSGSFYGEPLTVLVNHWPSRRGGELLSRANRNAAATMARRIADSVTKADPTAKIVLLGDFNDDPINISIKKIINTCGDPKKCDGDQYYNPMEDLYSEGTGSIAWNDSWNLFDQVILNKNWLPKNYESWQYYAVRVFNKAFLKSDYGNNKGAPFTTYHIGTYTGGYSDHFPVFIVIAKEKK
ncbi:MAG: hypothetical protein H0U95_07035 [Bacteroidetes bacterium]|nr:hypothetical protein [Bacteroidota bacterium]